MCFRATTNPSSSGAQQSVNNSLCRTVVYPNLSLTLLTRVLSWNNKLIPSIESNRGCLFQPSCIFNFNSFKITLKQSGAKRGRANPVSRTSLRGAPSFVDSLKKIVMVFYILLLSKYFILRILTFLTICRFCGWLNLPAYLDWNVWSIPEQ